MEQPNPLFNRKHPAHGVIEFPNTPTVIFDTVCVKGRKPALANIEFQQIIVEIWTAARHWLVGHYMIMPDHVHYFAAAYEAPTDFDNWVKYWKSQLSKKWKTKNFSQQIDHWDKRMRNTKGFADTYHYVSNNPVRAKLVDQAQDWPYQGIVHPWQNERIII
jgi:REP element-mobilizing transposase RayT